MAVDGLIEFYATCHPPLNPKGVREAVDLAKNKLGDRLYEILYEPELPAFKIVAHRAERDAILEQVQHILQEVLHRDFDVFRDRSSSELDEKDLLDFSSDSSGRVTPWSEYNASDQSAIVRFDEFRFPLNMLDLRDKVIWRGLEEHTGWTLQVLVERVQSFWRGRDAPVDINGFAKNFGCQVQTNLGGTTIYIVADAPCGYMGAQDAALALQNLLEFFVANDVKVKHFVMSDDQIDAQFIFQTFSQLAFEHCTFHPHDVISEPSQLNSSATVRSIHSGWSQPYRKLATSSPLFHREDRRRPDSMATFEVFDSYVPRTGAAKDVAILENPRDACSKYQGLGLENSGYSLMDNWASADREPLSRAGRSEHQDSIEDWVPRSELLERRHLLDSDIPDTFLGEDFIPMQHLVVPPLLSDATSTMGLASSADSQPAELDSRHEDSDLIEFESSIGDDDSALCGTTRRLPGDIQALDVAFEKLKLVDCVEHDDSLLIMSGFQDELSCSESQEQALSRRQILPPRANRTAPKATDFWTNAKPELWHICEVLRMTPGKIELELNFGRIVLGNFDTSEIFDDRTQDGPSRTALRTCEYLQQHYLEGKGGLGFSSILSNCAADATVVAKIKPHGVGEWRSHAQERRVHYDFLCRSEDSQLPAFTITIDADSFAYEVTTTANELASAFIHCPQSAWDIKIGAMHHSGPQDVEKWFDYSQAVVESLVVSLTSENGAALSFVEPVDSLAIIKEVRQRQVAHYVNDEYLGTTMSVTLTKVMTLSKTQELRAQDRVEASLRTSNHDIGKPAQWVDVTMHSHQARQLLSKRMAEKLAFGKPATGITDGSFEAPGGIWDELCWPALGMIAEMDACGPRRDHGPVIQPSKRHEKRLVPKQPAVSQPRATSGDTVPYQFW